MNALTHSSRTILLAISRIITHFSLSLLSLFLSYHTASTLAPTPHDDDLQRARAIVLEAIEGRGWQSLGTKENVELYTNPHSPFPATRGVATVDAHPLLLHALYADTEHRKTWDPMVESGQLLERIDRLTYVAYSLFRAPWPVSRRDMHIIGRGERLADSGAYLSYGTSITAPPTTRPSPRGVVRAHLVYYGTLITPLAGGRCRVVFVGCSDPRGMLPSALVAIAAQLQPLNINRLVAFSRREGVRAEVEKKLMAGIREDGFDEEEGRLNERTAAPPTSVAVEGSAGGDAGKEEADEEKKSADDDDAEQSSAAADAKPNTTE